MFGLIYLGIILDSVGLGVEQQSCHFHLMKQIDIYFPQNGESCHFECK